VNCDFQRGYTKTLFEIVKVWRRPLSLLQICIVKAFLVPQIKVDTHWISEMDSPINQTLLESENLTMKRIWAPWRMVYIKAEREEGLCLFCDRLDLPDGLENLILHRGDSAFIILNRYPYTNGHLMVVPYAHEASLEGLEQDTLGELLTLTSKTLTLLRNVLGAQDFNVGINIGETAGAGVADHVHIHVVPRWPGDTSFMTSVGETRVIPEALEETFEKLHAGWIKLQDSP
jgi:ATP adenylyltransferase